MNVKKPNLSKIEHIAELAFKNSLRLHYDSISLFRLKSYPSAYYLSIIVLEELGKLCILEDFCYHSRVDGLILNEKELQDFFRSIYSHKIKQNWFLSYWRDLFPKRYVSNIYNRKIESEKQHSLYVGLKKNGKHINIKGRIYLPSRIKYKKAKEQITLINDFLLSLILGVKKGIYMVDSLSVEKLLHRRLSSKLEKIWPYKKSITRDRLHNFEKELDID